MLDLQTGQESNTVSFKKIEAAGLTSNGFLFLSIVRLF